MAKINEQEFVEELIFCIKAEDTIKATALLQYFPEAGEKIQERVVNEIHKAPPKMAYSLLHYLFGGRKISGHIRQMMNEVVLEISFGSPALLAEYLLDSDFDDKLLYIRIAGDIQSEETVPALMNILDKETDPDILIGTLFALGQIGSEKCVKAIAHFLYYGDDALERAAIDALAEIGSPTAIQRLAESIRESSNNNSLVVEALARIQDHTALEKLCGMLSSHFVDLRNMAIDHLVAIGVKAVPILVDYLKSEDTDVVIHTSTILGKIGDETAIPPIQKLLYKKPKDSNVRFAAYEALGRIPSKRSAISLAIGLEDPDEQVRLSAARAIDTNISTVLIAGLKNIIEPSDEHAKNVVATFIDAEADNVFNALIEWGTFQAIGAVYLSRAAHPDIRDHFQVLLRGRGNESLAEIIQTAAEGYEKKGQKLLIYAVDDSKMLLNLYIKKLHKMGHEPVTFQFPAKAIDAVMEKKPDLVITDLNMPEINGVQLTQKLRQAYPSKALPIIMITTQSDVTDNDGIRKAGVDIVLNKPFKDEDLDAAIKKLVKR